MHFALSHAVMNTNSPTGVSSVLDSSYRRGFAAQEVIQLLEPRTRLLSCHDTLVYSNKFDATCVVRQPGEYSYALSSAIRGWRALIGRLEIRGWLPRTYFDPSTYPQITQYSLPK